MNKYVFVSLILTGALLLAGCQHGLYLRFSDKKVVGVDVNEETEGPGGTNTSEKSFLEDETIEPSGEITGSEERDTETSDEQTTEPERPDENVTPGPQDDCTTTAPKPESRTPDPRTTDAPTTTRPPETTAVKTTQAPTTQAPTTTEDTEHIEANVEHIEIHTLPTKTFYDQYNEIISTEGMTLLARWADGYEKIITGGWKISAGNGLKFLYANTYATYEEGEHTIYVRYGERTTTFTITYQLAANATLQLEDHFSSDRVFYQGEYVKHLFSAVYAGDKRVTNLNQVSYSPERLDKVGTVTVTITYEQYSAVRTFTVVSASQYKPSEYELFWISFTPRDYGCTFRLGEKISAKKLYEYMWNYDPYFFFQEWGKWPVPSDILPDEEFIFDPAVANQTGVISVGLSCRGVSTRIGVAVVE